MAKYEVDDRSESEKLADEAVNQFMDEATWREFERDFEKFVDMYEEKVLGRVS